DDNPDDDSSTLSPKFLWAEVQKMLKNMQGEKKLVIRVVPKLLPEVVPEVLPEVVPKLLPEVVPEVLPE
ncbi:10601_t:CDS:2, partial [Racocetra fulgida]